MEYINLDQVTIQRDKQSFLKNIHVRKAKPADVNEIYKIASSVGQKDKHSEQGFLIDDYKSNPSGYKEIFLSRIFELNYFYVACDHKPLAFLMAYNKDQWLKYYPDWSEDLYWKPNFDMNKTKSFILIDKTAVSSGMTGMGIGSKLYKRLIRDMTVNGIRDIFAETVIDPVPNMASLAFREKQNYKLAGMRYEEYDGRIITDLIYHKRI